MVEERRRSRFSDSLSLFVYDGDKKVGKTTGSIDGRFLHWRLLIDCLLKMQSNLIDRREFFEYCRAKYSDGVMCLADIEKFEQTYEEEQSIWWYTRSSFVYRLLNDSLRDESIDLLFSLRFYIRDIAKQLEKLRYNSPITLYRGQKMSKEELNVLQQAEGRLICANQFLSTSSLMEIGEIFAGFGAPNDQCESVLIIIHADPTRPGTQPFAAISDISEFPQENEFLMMLGSVFRLESISSREKGAWYLEMTLCSDEDHDLIHVCEHMMNQYGINHARMLRFGHALVDMGRFDDAEKYYKRFLKELCENDREISKYYQALGKVACEQAQYQLSIEWLFKALRSAEEHFGKNHSRLAFFHTSLGEVYQKQSKHHLALEAFENALMIWQTKSLQDQQPIAWCYNNIGIVKYQQEKYTEALAYHQKALEIKEELLPINHPCLGNAYLNLGNDHCQLGQYDRALENYYKCLNIQ